MTDSIPGGPVQILLVEDSAGDVSLTREALLDTKVPNRLNVVGDGVEAMAYLRGEGGYAGMPRPDLLLLDLNLPRKDGREVLTEMKEDEGLKDIPVVVLTTSSAEADIVRSYKLHANAFVTKPVEFNDFLRTVHGIEEFWLELVRLPYFMP
jgi:CheY-like chemotaxis protein